MSTDRPLFTDDARHRETMRLLLTSMGCQWVLGSSAEEAVRILSRGPAGAAVLDSRVAICGSHQKNDKSRDIEKYSAGRVIVDYVDLTSGECGAGLGKDHRPKSRRIGP